MIKLGGFCVARVFHASRLDIVARAHVYCIENDCEQVHRVLESVIIVCISASRTNNPDSGTTTTDFLLTQTPSWE